MSEEPNNTEQLSFEEALKRLSTIVEKLEKEEVGLDESIKLYEEGVKLSRLCSSKLENAELKIEQVNKNESE